MYILTKDGTIWGQCNRPEYKIHQPNGFYRPVPTHASSTHFQVEGELYPSYDYQLTEVAEIPEGVEYDGTWTYSNGEFTHSEELKSEQVRGLRDELLTACDWQIATDSPLDSETQEKVRAYRQKLRDIPQQSGFPFAVEFPELQESQEGD